jgi:hypothetical protein
MKPQINLYNPQLRLKRERLSFRTLLAGMGAVVLLSALGYAWYGLQAADAGRRARALDARLQALRDETVALSKALSERRADAALESRLKQLEAQHARLEAVRAALDRITGSNGAAFSEFMRAFARQTMPGVWLTGIAVTGDGAEMRIDGRAVDPDLVPAYIARLNGEPLLQGRSFAQLTVSQPPAATTPAAAAATPAREQTPAQPFHEFRLVSSPGEGAADTGRTP